MYLAASRDELQARKVKLDYEEFVLCQKEVSAVWDKMLSTPGRAKVKVDMEKVHTALSQGQCLIANCNFHPNQLVSPQLSPIIVCMQVFLAS